MPSGAVEGDIQSHTMPRCGLIVLTTKVGQADTKQLPAYVHSMHCEFPEWGQANARWGSRYLAPFERSCPKPPIVDSANGRIETYCNPQRGQYVLGRPPVDLASGSPGGGSTYAERRE